MGRELHVTSLRKKKRICILGDFFLRFPLLLFVFRKFTNSTVSSFMGRLLGKGHSVVSNILYLVGFETLHGGSIANRGLQ